jgi:hypothetical protein
MDSKQLAIDSLLERVLYFIQSKFFVLFVFVGEGLDL